MGNKIFKRYLLIPLSIIWVLLSRIKAILANPYNSKLKVICVGNLTIGGTGKTPFAISTFKWLKDLGYNPVFLTRGYGGKQIEIEIVEYDWQFTCCMVPIRMRPFGPSDACLVSN